MGPRKKLQESGNNITDFLSKVQNNNKLKMPTLCSAANISDNWRWIDFIDPKTNLPCLPLEYLFGCRGMLSGRFVKIEADPGIGKSSYLFLQYAMGQISADVFPLHFESEGAPPPADYIAKMGCNPKKIGMSQPRSIEDCMEQIETLVYEWRKGDPDKEHIVIVGIDSISGLGSDNDANIGAEYDKMTTANCTNSGAGLAGHARFFSKWFRERGCLWLIEHDVMLVGTAQLKDNIVIGGPPGFQLPADQKKKTIADTVLNFNASYILAMKSSLLRNKDKVDIGELVTIRTKKNKISPKNREIQLPLIRGEGFNLLEAAFDFLKFRSPFNLKDGSQFIIEQKGPWISCPTLFDSNLSSNSENKEAIVRKVYENTDLLMAIRESMKIRGFGFDFEKEYEQNESEDPAENIE